MRKYCLFLHLYHTHENQYVPFVLHTIADQLQPPHSIKSKYKKNSFEPTFPGLWRSGIWNMVSTQGSAPRIHGFPKGPSRRPGHQTRQLQDRRCHTSNRAIDNYNFYPFLKVKDTDILLIFIWKFVGIQGYLWQLVCTNKYRIVRYGFSMKHRSWSEEQIL